MVNPFPSKTQIGNHMLHPETLMLNYGYDPQLSEGAVKPPVFLTSTFVFKTAEDGQDFFDFVSGRREPPEGMGAGLVYSRFNPPNSEIVEDRLAVYERTEKCALFSSGMAAIATTILAYARPGDVILHSQPLYGGTGTLFSKTLAGLSIGAVGFADGIDETPVRPAAQDPLAKSPVAMIFIQTPANPPNRPADNPIGRPHAPAKVADSQSLAYHEAASPAGRLFARQCTGAGSTFSFDIVGGQAAAFKFLNALQIFKLAVSLGGTESLASLPASMTHSGVPADIRQKIGVLDSAIRLSIGIEHPSDLIADIGQALNEA